MGTMSTYSSHYNSHFPRARAELSSSGIQIFEQTVRVCGKSKHQWDCSTPQQLGIKLVVRRRGKSYIVKAEGNSNGAQEASTEGSEKRGTITGAVSLIIGTSVGSGILALPEKTSHAGFIPSASTIILCWLFLTTEALLLAEVNVHLWGKMKRSQREGDELEVVSLRTMAQETLGGWGGNIATITYLFLAYSSIVAYTSKSGEVISHLINLPDSISGILFTFLISLLIFIGGTHITDQVNQWLTVTMIGLLAAIEVIAFPFLDTSSSIPISNWFKVPSTIPVIIFSLVYHDIAPVICAYLGGDLMRIRLSIVLGSLIPLLTLLIWDYIALSSHYLDGNGFLEFLVRGSSSITWLMVEAFSLLAVGTSLIGTLLGFSEFFKEQLEKLFIPLHPIHLQSEETRADSLERSKIVPYNTRDWWRSNGISFLATSMAIVPPVFISTIIPDAFSTSTDIAGGYCMTMLYGVLPPTMAWAMQSRQLDNEEFHNDRDRNANGAPIAISNVKPILVGVGLFSCLIVMEQMLQNFTIFIS